MSSLSDSTLASSHFPNGRAYLDQYCKYVPESFALIVLHGTRLMTNDLIDHVHHMKNAGLFPIILIRSINPMNPATLSSERMVHTATMHDSIDAKDAVLKCKKMISQSKLPIIIDASISFEMHYLLINQLIDGLHTHKCVIISEKAGLYDESNNRIPFINLRYFNSELPNAFDRDLILAFKMIGKNAPHCSFVITSSKCLLEEMFTIKGAGTYCRYFQIDTHQSPVSEKITQSVRSIIEDAFNKPLKKDYSLRSLASVYIQSDHDGCAIIEPLDQSLNYLDKFAVRPLAQGTGLGKSLWLKIANDFPAIIWRSSTGNPLHSFYEKEANGYETTTNWVIYWKGCTELQAKKHIQSIEQRPSSFTKE